MARLKPILLLLLVTSLVPLRGDWRRAFTRTPAERFEEHMVRSVAVGRVLVERGWVVSLDSQPVIIEASGELVEVAPTGTRVRQGDVVVRLDDAMLREGLAEEEFGLYDAEQELASYQASFDYVTTQQDNLLASLERRLACAGLDEEEARRGLGPEQRRLLAIEVEMARLDLADAEEEEARQRRLFEKGFISAAMFEPYQRQVETRRAHLAEAEARKRLEEKGVEAEVLLEMQRRRERIEAQIARGAKAKERRLDEARRQIQGSEYHVDRHRQQKAEREEELSRTVARAPRDGIVSVRLQYSRSGGGWTEYRPGVQRYRGDRLADIVDVGRMRVELMIHESDLDSVRVGQRARIRLPAHPGVVLEGEVTQVGGVGRDRTDVAPSGYEWGRSGITMFNASVSVEAGDMDLRPGMSAIVELQVESPARRLVLPRQAVRLHESRYHVLRRLGERVVEHAVQGQALDDLHFAIDEGLTEGDVVLTPAVVGAPP
ncbi:MAG: HlyD family efflux transporter periplasmic adaptor subunit [Lentisphaeria bacterium]|nr:HlyD family efflux transporter periplasmic adaptor subunit [Lentisphaeria bacterium]